MSDPIRQTSEDNKVDLGTGIHWPAVCGVAIVVIAVVGGLAALCAVCARVPAPANDSSRTEVSTAQLPDKTSISSEKRPVATPAAQHQTLAARLAQTECSEPKRVFGTPPLLPDPIDTPFIPPRVVRQIVGCSEDVADIVSITAEAVSYRRLDLSGYAELEARLVKDSRDVDLGEEDQARLQQALAASDPKKSQTQSDGDCVPKSRSKTPLLFDMIADRYELRGLPVRDLTECQAPEADANRMDPLSCDARRDVIIPRLVGDGRRDDHSYGHDMDADNAAIRFIRETPKRSDWHEATGVRMLTQMFGADDTSVREQLVRSLGEIGGKDAAQALARIAVFDLNADIRNKAIGSLSKHLAADWRPTFVAALRYPWSPAADHAAEGLVALRDRSAAAELVGLLDAPDPAKPRLNTDGKWRVSELVRVNHLANCLLCHAPASKKDGVMHGVVPIRGRSLADVYCFDRNQKLVRADITYIKQDFSVSHDMSEKTRWPRMQRFDYMLRTRELCQTEIAQLCDNACCDVADSTDYPQRRAVLWALRELTGQDMGDRSESWRRYLEQTYASPVP